MNALRTGLITLLALVVVTLPARADDVHYQDYPIGSRAGSLGGAFTALSNDASGLTYNPAGIVDTRQLEINLSTSLYGLERQALGTGAVVNGGTFSLATLATLNVIPGEAGSIKGIDPNTDGASQWAWGFDVTVPSFRSYGTDEATPVTLHTRIVDRTFDAAAGAAYRIDSRWSVGAALHFILRTFTDTEDALVTDGAVDPKIGVYHAEASFTNGGLSLTLGGKLRLDDGWALGAALSTPPVEVYSTGSVQVQDVVTDPNNVPHTTVNVLNTTNVNSSSGIPWVIRLGAAKERPQNWTLSGQLTFYTPISYDRFQLDANTAARLQLQTHVDRHAVANVNVGGEYYVDEKTMLMGGLFTDFTPAPALEVDAAGTIIPGTSRLDHVSLYGGTFGLGFVGDHSTTRIGVSLAYGSGQQAVANDPTGMNVMSAYTEAQVSQLFFYVFLAGTSRY